MDFRDWDYGSRLPRDRRLSDPSPGAAGGYPTRVRTPVTVDAPWGTDAVTDTGSMEPIPDAVIWAMRADAWAQQQQDGPEQPDPWGSAAARFTGTTGRPTFQTDGVGWRSHTAEWRSTAEASLWRETTEWRSSTGNHHWRSTIEAGWQTGDNGDGVRPPAAPPTRQPAISGTAWPTASDQEPPSWQETVAPPARSANPTWQASAESWQQGPAEPNPTQPEPPLVLPLQSRGTQEPGRGSQDPLAPSWQAAAAGGVAPAWPGSASQEPPTRQQGAGRQEARSSQQSAPDAPSRQNAPDLPSWQQKAPDLPSWQQNAPDLPSWQQGPAQQGPSTRPDLAGPDQRGSNQNSLDQQWREQARPELATPEQGRADLTHLDQTTSSWRQDLDGRTRRQQPAAEPRGWAGQSVGAPGRDSAPRSWSSRSTDTPGQDLTSRGWAAPPTEASSWTTSPADSPIEARGWAAAPSAPAPRWAAAPSAEPPGWAPNGGVVDPSRHLVREDDRARWRRDFDGGTDNGRRRAAEPVDPYTPGSTGWAGTYQADNWAGHTDTGNLTTYAGGDSWAARTESSWSTDAGARSRSDTSRRSWPTSGAGAPVRGGEPQRTERSAWTTGSIEREPGRSRSAGDEPRWRGAPDDTASWRSPVEDTGDWRTSVDDTASWRGGPADGRRDRRDTQAGAGSGRAGSQRDGARGDEYSRGSAADAATWRQETPPDYDRKTRRTAAPPERGGYAAQNSERTVTDRWQRAPVDGRPDDSWRRDLGADEPDRPRPEARDRWQEQRSAGGRGTAQNGYRNGENSVDDWRWQLASEATDDLRPGESRRYGTHDFPDFRPAGSPSPRRDGRRPESGAGPRSASGRAVVRGRVEPPGRSTALLVPNSGDSWQDPPRSTWPPSGASTGTQSSVAGPYERRPVGTLTRPTRLDEADDGLEEVTGGPLAAVGYVAMWYAIPVVLFVLYMLVLDSDQQSHALQTLVTAAPRFGLSLGLSMAVAVGLRSISGTWKSASVGLAAAVMGGGLATVLISVFTGQALS